jgi:hypothetical protein
MHVTEPSPPPHEVKPSPAGTSGTSTSSALCSAYPQLGAINAWARPGVLYWTAQGQLICHSSIQVTIAVSISSVHYGSCCCPNAYLIIDINYNLRADAIPPCTSLHSSPFSVMQETSSSTSPDRHLRLHRDGPPGDGRIVPHAHQQVRHRSNRRGDRRSVGAGGPV